MKSSEIPREGKLELGSQELFELHPSLKTEGQTETENRTEEIRRATNREELARILENWGRGDMVVTAYQKDGSAMLFIQDELEGMAHGIRGELTLIDDQMEKSLTRQFDIRAKWNELVEAEQRNAMSTAKNIDELLRILPVICPIKGGHKSRVGGWISFEDSTGDDGEKKGGIKSAVNGIRDLDASVTDERRSALLQRITGGAGLREKVRDLLDAEHIDRIVKDLNL